VLLRLRVERGSNGGCMAATSPGPTASCPWTPHRSRRARSRAQPGGVPCPRAPFAVCVVLPGPVDTPMYRHGANRAAGRCGRSLRLRRRRGWPPMSWPRSPTPPRTEGDHHRSRHPRRPPSRPRVTERGVAETSARLLVTDADAARLHGNVFASTRKRTCSTIVAATSSDGPITDAARSVQQRTSSNSSDAF
jgi:hypothetical protein